MYQNMLYKKFIKCLSTKYRELISNELFCLNPFTETFCED